MKKGDIVISASGHDRGTFYVVVGEKDEMLLLCDGKRKLLQSPKKKNRKHLEETGRNVDLSAFNPLYDAHILKALKCVKKDICL